MPARPIRVGFVLHVMQVAGAEILVAEIIRRLAHRIEPVIFCLDGLGQLGEELRRDGVDVVVLDRREGWDFKVAARLAREIRARDLDVVHAHQYTPFFYAALARLRARAGWPLIFTEHGRHYPDVVPLRRRLVNRCALQYLASEVTGVCQFSAESLAAKDGFTAKAIRVIQNGIDVERYEDPGRATGSGSSRAGVADRRYLLCAARFHPVKDHATLLQAFALVADGHPDVDLVLAGDGPLRGDLQALSSALGIAGRVQFLGVRSDVPALLREADVFVLPSLSEAASLTVLEAMASGRPVVATAVGGNPELVRHGVDGLLVPRSDPAAMAQALARLLADSVERRRMGESGRARVREHFQLRDSIEVYHGLYAAAAARVGATSGTVVVSEGRVR